jgi:hypothetical protein
LNQQRAEDLAAMGHRFRGILEVAACWHIETFRFLKGSSRVIALADYRAEKRFVLAVPHRFLLGEPDLNFPPCPRFIPFFTLAYRVRVRQNLTRRF